MDKIIIKNAEFICDIGIYKEEKEKKQKIILDLTLFYDIEEAINTDSIDSTINYKEVIDLTKKVVEKKHYELIENLSENICNEILDKFKLEKIILKVKKPKALKNAEYAAVEIIRWPKPI